MKQICDYIFKNELQADPTEHNVLFTIRTRIRKSRKREKKLQIAFESFNVLSASVVSTAFLLIYIAQRTTGIVRGLPRANR